MYVTINNNSNTPD